MANLNNFNANNVEPQTEFDAIPAGKYLAVITSSEMKPTKSGNGAYLELTFDVIEGEFKGRKLWARLNLDNYWKSEWVCIKHTGFARQKAEMWWAKRTSEPAPNTADEACDLACAGALRAPTAITIKSIAGESFDRIVGYDWPTDTESCRSQPEPEYVQADDSIPF